MRNEGRSGDGENCVIAAPRFLACHWGPRSLGRVLLVSALIGPWNAHSIHSAPSRLRIHLSQSWTVNAFPSLPSFACFPRPGKICKIAPESRTMSFRLLGGNSGRGRGERMKKCRETIVISKRNKNFLTPVECHDFLPILYH